MVTPLMGGIECIAIAIFDHCFTISQNWYKIQPLL